MKRFLIALSAVALVFGMTAARADDTSLINNMDMKTLTPSQSAQVKAEREAVEANYTKMTLEQKAALRKSAQQKRQAELNALESVSQRDDMGRYMAY
jgi:hypothetical protein